MKNEKGSSLVEVTVAMIILALLVTGLNACVINLINSNVSAKELSAATSSGYQLLEELRRIDYSSITSSSDMVRSKFIRTWTVTSDSVQKKIDLTITWPLSTGKHSIDLSTIIAKP
ncbi:MAG TPA: prepilin-type N-terminal cleavage/methylation domain-containing protein [Chitinispirillaceae bacterium]|nr:prepilin-type N-terminal cleavage/methylation domain-containing protein [Chitinispirillaceae bacterium]